MPGMIAAPGHRIQLPGPRTRPPKGAARPTLQTVMLLLAMLLLAGPLPAFASEPVDSDPIEFTAEERAFLDRHPEVTFGSGLSFAPFVLREPSGAITGHDAEIAALIEARTGLRIRFELGVWGEIQQRARMRALDGLATAVVHKDREKFFIATTPYVSLTGLVIVRSGNPADIYSAQDLVGKRLILQRNNVNFENMARQVASESHWTYVDTIDETITALVSREADFTILDETAFFVARQLGLAGLIEAAFAVGQPYELVFQVRRDWPELASILNKGLATISIQEQMDLRQRWLEGSDQLPVPTSRRIPLTEEEADYLQARGPLHLCTETDWMPFARIVGERIDGMAGDFVDLLQDSLGVAVEPMPLATRAPGAANGIWPDCDMLALTHASPAALPGFRLTKPLFQLPYVLVTRTEEFFITDLNTELHRRFSFGPDPDLAAELRRRYPTIQLEPVDTVRDGLEKVRTREVFAHIGTTADLAYIMREAELVDLKVSGRLSWDADFAMAVRADEPMLHRIIQTVLDGTQSAEINRILNRWLAMEVRQVPDYELLVRTAVIAALLIGLFAWWNLRLQQANRRAEQAAKARTTFIASVNHELRTPLNAILAMAEALADDPLPAPSRRRIDLLQRASTHLRALIENVLDFARTDIGDGPVQERWFSLDALIERTTELFARDLAAKGLSLQTRIAPALPDFHLGDDRRIHQSLVNLIGNAVKFTQTGLIEVSATPLADGVRICVTDTGPGIDAKQLDRIFEPFHQIKPEAAATGQGLGLGLTITASLVRHMGGRIQVDSTPGRGSTFLVDLPLPGRADAPPSSPTAVRDADSAAPAMADIRPVSADQPARVLVVEDSDLNQEVIRDHLAGLPLTLVACRNGREAVALATGEPVDIVLMDVQVPEMDGLAALKAIRALEARRDTPRVPPKVPIVFQSADTRPEVRQQALAAGADAFLTKPYTRHQLRATVLASLGQSPPPAREAPPESLKSLFPRLKTELRDQLAAAEDALARADLTQVAAHAHVMKGHAETFGQSRLADQARALERAAVRSAWNDVSSCLTQLGHALHELDDEEQPTHHPPAGG
jgi:signal transduction histidine kinase/CheY-like chemotaxis protein